MDSKYYMVEVNVRWGKLYVIYRDLKYPPNKFIEVNH